MGRCPFVCRGRCPAVERMEQNVVESKERIIEAAAAPYIVARGRKGGSNVAAAICNAMLYQIRR